MITLIIMNNHINSFPKYAKRYPNYPKYPNIIT